MAQFTGNLKEDTSKRSVAETSRRLILALQHLIAMFGATVLVPILTGLDPSVALCAAGMGTLIFHLCTKGKVPVFLGSSFAFIAPIIAVGNMYDGDLRYAQGGIIVAGLIYILVSFIVQKIGVANIRKVLPAQVIGPMIMVIGINLLPTALDMAGINLLIDGADGAVLTVAIAAITLVTALAVKFTTKGFISQVSILIAVVVGYIISLVCGQVAVSEISNASYLAIPNFTLPKFSWEAILIIAPIVIAVFMEHVGDITTNGQVVGKNFIEEPGLNRTLLGDGLATLVAGLIGGPANTTYGENTGVLAMTKNYDPSILRITAVFAIALSFIGKFGAAIRTIPTAVMGGISIILFSMIALIGIKTMKNEKVKMDIANIILMVVILFVGLAPNILGLNIGIKITEEVALSGLSLAAILGIVLNLVIQGLRNGKSSTKNKSEKKEKIA